MYWECLWICWLKLRIGIRIIGMVVRMIIDSCGLVIIIIIVVLLNMIRFCVVSDVFVLNVDLICVVLVVNWDSIFLDLVLL